MHVGSVKALLSTAGKVNFFAGLLVQLRSFWRFFWGAVGHPQRQRRANERQLPLLPGVGYREIFWSCAAMVDRFFSCWSGPQYRTAVNLVGGSLGTGRLLPFQVAARGPPQSCARWRSLIFFSCSVLGCRTKSRWLFVLVRQAGCITYSDQP
jgi:hypothetical protein